ncbi:hypothetical protein HY485_01830, partial [Candidatus Woesearchaeota archaeon]|nr:hypothetical protein [Candidatus Woesearchaeota archaeon]
MIRIQIPKAKEISGVEVRKILGRNPRFMAISGGYLELPDDTTVAEADAINTAFYPDEAKILTETVEQRLD